MGHSLSEGDEGQSCALHGLRGTRGQGSVRAQPKPCSPSCPCSLGTWLFAPSTITKILCLEPMSLKLEWPAKSHPHPTKTPIQDFTCGYWGGRDPHKHPQGIKGKMLTLKTHRLLLLQEVSHVAHSSECQTLRSSSINNHIRVFEDSNA